MKSLKRKDKWTKDIKDKDIFHFYNQFEIKVKNKNI